MQLICLNAKFKPDQLAFYEIHGIVTPQQDNLYTPRSISKNSNGDWEVLLNEIVNKEVPIVHKVLGVSYKEPAWALTRFANLLRDSITEEEVKEFKKQEKLIEK